MENDIGRDSTRASRLEAMKRRVAYAAMLVALFAVGLCPPARATSLTWNNGAGDMNWNTTSLDWTGLAWPTVSYGDNDAVFGATGVGTINIAAGGVTANDLTFNTAGYSIAGPGTLTLDGGAGRITTNQAATITANLSGTGGIQKYGSQSLTLSGDNSGLQGMLAINNVASTNNNGVYVTSLAALGGITNVLVSGSGATSGGFFRLSGTGIAVPATVMFNLMGQGGSSTPNGTLVGSGTGVNSIAGGVFILGTGVRISNIGATRLDITGAITQVFPGTASDNFLFRYADNEGVHLTNTANSWSVLTHISQGVLWFEPGALPATTNLQIAASGNAVVQTSGSFTRALGTGANQVQFSLSSGRTMGFGARGGDLVLDFGGAGADVLFDTGASAAASTIRTSILNLNNSTATHKLTLVNALDLNGAARTLQVDANTVELTGGLKNSTGSSVLTRTGNGRLVVTGGITGGLGMNLNGGLTEFSGSGGASTFTGVIGLYGGSLLVKRADGLGSPVGVTGSAGGQNQGVLQFDASGGDIITPEPFSLGMRASVVANNFSAMQPNISNLAGNTTLTGLVNGITGGAVTKISSDGGLLILAGEYRQTGGSPTASIRVGQLQGSGEGLVSGTITQAANIQHRLEKVGSGTWTITNPANTFSGGVRIMEGTLAVNGIGNGGTAGVLGAAGNTADNIQFNGGTLRYEGYGETTDRLFTIGAAGATIEASGAGSVVFGNTGAIATANGGSTGIQYSFPASSTIIAANDTSTLSAGMEVGGVAGLAAGTRIVSVDHTSGLVMIDKPTTASAAVIGTGTAGGVLDRTLTLGGSNTGNNTLAGGLSDAANGGELALTKSGSGTWVLNGGSTYTGPTTVTAGALLVNGALGHTVVMVGTSAMLGGGSSVPGVIAGEVGVSGTLAPGNSPGTLSLLSDLHLYPSSILEWEIDPTNTAVGAGINDLVTVTGSLTLDGTLDVTGLGSFSGINTGTWTLLTYGTLSGNSLGLGTLPALDPGLNWELSAADGAVQLAIVPEACGATLALLGLGFLLRRRR